LRLNKEQAIFLLFLVIFNQRKNNLIAKLNAYFKRDGNVVSLSYSMGYFLFPFAVAWVITASCFL